MAKFAAIITFNQRPKIFKKCEKIDKQRQIIFDVTKLLVCHRQHLVRLSFIIEKEHKTKCSLLENKNNIDY